MEKTKDVALFISGLLGALWLGMAFEIFQRGFTISRLLVLLVASCAILWNFYVKSLVCKREENPRPDNRPSSPATYGEW